MSHLSMAVMLAIFMSYVSDLAWAAVNKTQMAPAKILRESSSVAGGVAGTGFSLLDMRKSQDKKNKIERLVFDIGDLQGKTQKGYPGYYHVQMAQNPSRLIIDFSQMPAAKINAQDIQKRLSASMYVKSSEFALDPIDRSLSLVLFLKNKPRAKVFQVAGKKATSKVIVDLIQ